MDWNIVAWMELPKPFKEDEISVCENYEPWLIEDLMRLEVVDSYE